MSARWNAASRPSLLETAGHGGTVSLVIILLCIVATMAGVL